MEFRNMITGALITPTDWQLALVVGDCYEIANSTGAVGDGVRFQIFDMPTNRRRADRGGRAGLLLRTRLQRRLPGRGDRPGLHLRPDAQADPCGVRGGASRSDHLTPDS